MENYACAFSQSETKKYFEWKKISYSVHIIDSRNERVCWLFYVYKTRHFEESSEYLQLFFFYWQKLNKYQQWKTIIAYLSLEVP